MCTLFMLLLAFSANAVDTKKKVSKTQNQTNSSKSGAQKNQYGTIPKIKGYGGIPKGDAGLNRRPSSSDQYGRVPSGLQNDKKGAAQRGTTVNRRPSSSDQYGRVPSGLQSDKKGAAQRGTTINRRPSSSDQYGTVPAVKPYGQLPGIKVDRQPKIAAKKQVGTKKNKIYRTLNLSSRAKKLFMKAIIKPFDIAKVKIIRNHSAGIQPANDPSYDEFLPRPKANSGVLGAYIGGGANALVYEHPTKPGYVQKLVRIEGPYSDGGRVTDLRPLPNNILVANDQMAGREILNRFKQTHKGKILGKLVQVSEIIGEPEVLEVENPRGRGKHRFIKTVEQNIKSPVYYKDSGGRFLTVQDEKGNVLEATNATDRLEILAKNKIRLESLAKGRDLKFSDIPEPSLDALRSVISPKQELAINAVVRGLNKHGIVWTDHKMENFDVVADPKSPLGYVVKFFDFDGFRVVKGKNPKERSKAARELQKLYDHKPLDAPHKKQESQVEFFDFTATGGFVAQVSSPHANKFRRKYDSYDNQNDASFNQQVTKQTQGRVKSIWE